MCETGVQRALGPSVHRPTSDTERQISLGRSSFDQYRCGSVPLQLHQEQHRDPFRAIAIDDHRVFYKDSISLTTRASGPGWTSASVPHVHGVHRNLCTTSVDPSSPRPLQKLTHTITIICFLHEFRRCLVLSHSMRLLKFPCAERG